MRVDWEALDLRYSPMYSAWDGVHAFSLPAYVDGVATSPEDWQAIPAEAVTFEPWEGAGGEVGVMVTVQGPVPEVVLAAHSGEAGGVATLHVTVATPEGWQIGKDRYEDGAMLDLGVFINAPGSPVPGADEPAFQGMPADPTIDPGAVARCDGCHGLNARGAGVMHTPVQTAGYSDAELIGIFTAGMKPPGVGLRVLPDVSQRLFEQVHAWQMSEEQAKGLVIYLRSLEPELQGDVIVTTPFRGIGGMLPPECDLASGMSNFEACLEALPPSCHAPRAIKAGKTVCGSSGRAA